jgi:hypothetical protein
MGWEACSLENGIIRVIAVPAIGGRIMGYDLGPHSLFYVDKGLAGKLFSPEENLGDGSLAAWKNYGGDKTWPAPQGWDSEEQWHGPPDPVLDTGIYSVQELTASGESAVLRMVSPCDERTGLQISRQFTIQRGSSRVAVEISFKNVIERPIRWSIWDVVQLRADLVHPEGRLTYDPTCVVTAPTNPRSAFPRGFDVMFGRTDNPQWSTDTREGLLRAEYMWEIGKIGLDSTAGWIAFSKGSEGYSFSERFSYDPSGVYPDNGATIECWTVGRGSVGKLNYEGSDTYLMETEVLSPRCEISPGASAEFSLEWSASRCTGPVEDVQEGGCASRRLDARRKGDYVLLRGEFGVFDAGQVRLNWVGGAQSIGAGEDIRHADPLGQVVVDQLLVPPQGAQGVELRVVASSNGAERLLAAADIS